MKIYTLWCRGDGATWLESAWDEEEIAGNTQGWDTEIERVRKLAFDSNYELRSICLEVPWTTIDGMFKVPVVNVDTSPSHVSPLPGDPDEAY